MMSSAIEDLPFMRQALSLARAGLGEVWPNPSVGCVLVKHGRVVGYGRTGEGGRPHAEVNALRAAGSAAAGATAYVSLEPCSHWGVTPPCADALCQAGVARVVVAIEDPDPRVNGAGLTAMRRAGVDVEVGLCGDEARALNAGFFLRIQRGRPLVVRVDANEAASPVSSVRPGYDALLCSRRGFERIDGERWVAEIHGGRRPWLALMEPDVDAAPGHAFACRWGRARWIVTPAGLPAAALAGLRATGLQVLEVAPGPWRLRESLRALGQQGLTRLCVSAGDPLIAPLEALGLVDADPAVSASLG
jgi:diaminohydroxyphosphoribosylaminopyrimidine deaminase/5-amino-6-(5-phosphoribosylamino)uracil reductase